MSINALGDALDGSLLFLSVVPILLQLWVFQPYPPVRLLLIKQAPKGRGGGLEGGGGGGGVVCANHSHIPPCFCPTYLLHV